MSEQGYIYALECEGFVKIGWSRNPYSRQRIARTFNPFPVRLVGFFAATRESEAVIHENFKEDRVDGSEWFIKTDSVKEWMKMLTCDDSSALKAWIKENRGGQARLAKHLQINSSSISQWHRVPAHLMGKVSRFTGIPMRELRPDLFAAAGEIAA